MADKPSIARSWKTVKPSGVTITRNGDWFTLAWKIADDDYNRGQTVTYEAEIITASTVTKSGKKTTKYTTSKASGSYFVGNESYKGKRSLGAKTTELSVKVDATKFYPSVATRYLSKVIFKIQARRGKFEKETKTEISVYDPKVSDWVTKEWTCNIPYDVKSLTNTLTEYNRSKFSWAITSDEKMNQWFKQWEYESILLKNSTITDGSKVNFTPDNKNRTYHIPLTTGSSLEYDRYVTEDSTPSGWATTDTYTRWMRIRAKGPRGNSSKWRYAKHIYAKPKAPTNLSGSATIGSQTTSIHMQWKLDVIANRPVDHVIVQYLMAVPTGAGMGAPDEGWTDSPAGEIINTNTYDGVNFTIDSVPDRDECIWCRVAAVHDSYTTWSTPLRIYTTTLQNPSDISVVVNQETHRVTVTATNNCDNPGSQMFVRYFDKTSYPKGIDIGRIYHNESGSPITIQCPNWGTHTIYFQVYAVAAVASQITSSPLKADNSVTVYTVKPNAKSDMVSSGGVIPIIPSNVKLALTDIPGTVLVTWNWSSIAYEYVEISWADHEDAWTSTDPPQTTVLDRIEAPSWHISGLDINNTYYFRLRFGNITNGGETTWGGYSAAKSIELTVAPMAPVLYLSESVASLSSNVKAYWTYYAEDGTTQKYADLYFYNPTIAQEAKRYVHVQRVTSAESITFSPGDVVLQSGDTIQFALTVTSSAGKTSEYSDLAGLFVADPIHAVITEDSFVHDEEIEIEDGVYRTANVLTEMPISLKLEQPEPSEGYFDDIWTNSFVEVTTSISRAEDYYLDRPDESEFIGYEGEIVALLTQTDTSEVIIDTDDLLGYLDDGAKYRLTVTVKDVYGQSDSTDLDFEVHWSHQAIKPSANVTLNPEYDVVYLTPVAPDGTISTDVCDIYRLSTDKPELIYEGATFGQVYVDPFPTVGDNGGYRFVFKTANNDYITPENEIAWYDVDLPFDNLYQYIDFGNDTVSLLYNVDLSSSWAKDFKEQKYLGGSVQGDWNPAVSRTGSISGVVVTASDQSTIEKMRRLAEYSGICRIRTRDGSNYTANVTVSESRGHEPTDLVTSFTLNVTRVEPEELSALTYEEWAEFHDNEMRRVTNSARYGWSTKLRDTYRLTRDPYVETGKTYYEFDPATSQILPVQNIDVNCDPSMLGYYQMDDVYMYYYEEVVADVTYIATSTDTDYTITVLNASIRKEVTGTPSGTITYEVEVTLDEEEIYSAQNVEGTFPIMHVQTWERGTEVVTKQLDIQISIYLNGTYVAGGTIPAYINIPPVENYEPIVYEIGFMGLDSSSNGNVVVQRTVEAINFIDQDGDGRVVIEYVEG